MVLAILVVIAAPLPARKLRGVRSFCLFVRVATDPDRVRWVIVSDPVEHNKHNDKSKAKQSNDGVKAVLT